MTIDIAKLKALAEAATPGRVHDRLDSCGGGLKYECFGDDGSLVLKVDHKNDEWGFVGDKGEADEAFFLACTPAAVLALIAENEKLKVDLREVKDAKLGLSWAIGEIMGERDQLRIECEGLRDAAAVSAMRIKELDLLFGRYILAMRAAVIEDEHGKTDIAGMDWIFNSLAGPGQLPPEGEMDAQAYFDREIVAVDKGMEEVLAFHDARRAATGKGEQS